MWVSVVYLSLSSCKLEHKPTERSAVVVIPVHQIDAVVIPSPIVPSASIQKKKSGLFRFPAVGSTRQALAGFFK